MKKNILLLYVCHSSSIRATTLEHLFSFRRYADENVYYANLANRNLPDWLKKINYDLIIFHTLFLSTHWRGQKYFRSVTNRAVWTKGSKAIKVMMPQDEFINSDLYSEFINEFKIDKVFTVAPVELIPYIYQKVSRSSVRFERILTGYLDERRTRINWRKCKNAKKRPIDIGYRTSGKPVAWFGRLGYLKQKIADEVSDRASKLALKTDISTHPEDVILGNRWYEFLLKCRYVIGCESGTSIVDPAGIIKNTVDEFISQNPTASFDEIEVNCFPGVDGVHVLNAISPRHLEVCATGTCQILVEGEYNAILEPNVHYIPVKKDLSDLSDVLGSLGNDERRENVIANAYKDIVESGKYTYRKMVRQVIDGSMSIAHDEPRKKHFSEVLIYFLNLIYDIYGFHMTERVIKLKGSLKRVLRPILIGPKRLIFRG